MTIGEVYRKTDEFVKNEKDFTVVSVGGGVSAGRSEGMIIHTRMENQGIPVEET